MNYHEELNSLYKQMESELHLLDQTQKQIVKKYMVFAFDRGESSALKKISNRRLS